MDEREIDYDELDLGLSDDFGLTDDLHVDFASDDDIVTTRTLDRPIRSAIQSRKREFINGLKRQALSDLVQSLPAPDTDIYIVSNGSGGSFRAAGKPVAFEFGHFIPVLADMLRCSAGHLYVSTWTMNRAHAMNILDQYDAGVFARVTVATDPYFMRRESAVANSLITGLLHRKQRFIAFKNHVKALLIANADETRTVTVTGSANLSSQPRAEQFVLSTDPDLYRFLRNEFFEAMIHGG